MSTDSAAYNKAKSAFTPAKLLESLMAAELEDLGDDYFAKTVGATCPICQEVAVTADPSLSPENNPPADFHAVRPKGCRHVYHYACLFQWFDTQRSDKRELTCPMDRGVIVSEVELLRRCIHLYPIADPLRAQFRAWLRHHLDRLGLLFLQGTPTEGNYQEEINQLDSTSRAYSTTVDEIVELLRWLRLDE
ncbi:hypothetical protein P154DRAFT_533376 [Amniculicola lignicola CBS 123094]|uniref:RING-type domain-containing protein n=1 Tax=Amniculicola lignicola CBS 123094 TaxID=1392246 RepID=A0A6A5WKW6_9PLEO|nr:hypothetical protein P154DRAFT_533376 [Amniculicola lignicola CBS 123094]